MIPELFQILQPRVTPQVLKVIHRHLNDEQIGLLLVKLINPYVIFSQQEEAILRGVNRKTLRGMKARGEVPSLCVNAQDDSILPKPGSKEAKLPHRHITSIKPL
jgi:hypothetical protein